jgi:peptide-methionine (S)-S-oxide reductase
MQFKQLCTVGVATFLTAVFVLSCSSPAHPAHDLPVPAVDLPAAKPGEMQTAVFAGGCFWGAQAVFQQLNGVDKVVAGFAGGSKDTATYEQVCTDTTGHAESIQVTYDPAKISYGTLLRVFFTVFDPTTLNRQENDRGTQYRTAIFYNSDDQKHVAESYIKQITDAKIFDAPIVTGLEKLTAEKGFVAAEDYHQDYVQKHPEQPYVQACSLPKVGLVKEKFPQLLKTK